MNVGKRFAKTLANAAHHKLGFDIELLEVRNICSYADFFLIMSGKNRIHLQALQQTMNEFISDRDVKLFGVEGSPDSGWIIMDMGSIIVHLFDPEKRGYYNLYALWGDAPSVELTFSKNPPRLNRRR